jgi:tRNA A-37 threonylcarbamoyl transferase component Bud32
MYWPTPQDYNEAIQTPKISFKDPELQESTPELNALGLPRPNSGAFASVYRVTSRGRDWAVRCFLRNVEGQHERYMELSKFIMADDLIYTVWFEYIEQGIRVRDKWYPILKMEWVDGVSLDQYVRKNLQDKEAILQLLDRFLLMSDRLLKANVAHGDLQHGNILVVEDDLRLVDYDGMFVPALAGKKSFELGHPNYQHPQRSQEHFGPYLDYFSQRVISASLKSLAVDPSLWYKLGGGDECLLFRRSDFLNPTTSLAFSMLEYHPSADVKEVARGLRSMLTSKPEQLANSRTAGNDIPLPPLAEPSQIARAPGFVAPKFYFDQRGGLPDWMRDGDSSAAGANPPSVPGAVVRKRPSGPWPRYEHYNQALLNSMCFDDPELRSGSPILEERMYGLQGIVFHVRTYSRNFAVKCFLNEQLDRQRRYEEIRKYVLKGPARRYFVDFEYLPSGIQIKGYWFPVLKMDWVFGMSLQDYIEKNKGDRKRLDELSEQFREMVAALHEAGIAHGDLEPSNILVAHDQFKLVDYDNVYVPALQGLPSVGCGHPSFQHPGRRLSDFGPELDNFSAHIMYTELRYLSINPVLWMIVDERLRQRSAEPSLAFKFLDFHMHGEVRNTAKLLKQLLALPFNEVPTLEDTIAKSKREANLLSRLFQSNKTGNP